MINLQELTQDQLQQFEGSQTGQNQASTTQPAKAASRVSAAAASTVSCSDPRILKGDERTKFVTGVMNTTFFPERTDKETIRIS